MKKLILIFLLFYSAIFAQDFQFGWITDLHVGTDKGAAGLSAIVKDINARNAVKFVLITGDIAERGYSSQLDEAKTILDQLNVPYHIIPGNHDKHYYRYSYPDLFNNRKIHFKL